jgi:putative membrane protein
MFYDGYHIWGMHLIWWFIWGMLLVWIFATPWAIPGQRWVVYSPLDILQRRFASGKITKSEYQEQKEILEKDSAN